MAEAATLGLRAIALADHDNIDGIAAAQAVGSERGVEIVPGVELSVVWEKLRDLHLLGYAFDPAAPGPECGPGGVPRVSGQSQPPDAGTGQSATGRRGQGADPDARR